MTITYISTFTEKFHFSDIISLKEQYLDDKLEVIIITHPVPYIDIDPVPFEEKCNIIRSLLATSNVKFIKIIKNNFDFVTKERIFNVLSNSKVYASLDCMYDNTFSIVPYLNRVYNNDSLYIKGIKDTVNDKYPTNYPVVDILLFTNNDTKVILGKKIGETSTYRFIGGFFDKEDINFENAAIREVYEETNLKIKNPIYIGSSIINDWRYKDSKDSIVSSFFIARVDDISTLKASDDIEELKIIQYSELKNRYKELLVPNHIPLFELFIKNKIYF